MRICLLSYRGEPYCGGQGVYIHYLSKGLCDLGHEVHLLSGPPHPNVVDEVKVHKLDSLDLYSLPPWRLPPRPLRLLRPLNFYEFVAVLTGAFPEPFTFIPGDNRSIELADGSITSPFLEMFGRPSRDTGLESERNSNATDAQRLHLLNSTHVQDKVQRSLRLMKPAQRPKGKGKRSKGKSLQQRQLDIVYLRILSRYPTEGELTAVQEYIEKSGMKPYQATGDVVWALINSKEFLYRH